MFNPPVQINFATFTVHSSHKHKFSMLGIHLSYLSRKLANQVLLKKTVKNLRKISF